MGRFVTEPRHPPPERQKLRDALRELRDQAAERNVSQQQLISRASRRLAGQGLDGLRPQTVSGWFANGAVAQDFRQLWALIQVMVELTGRLPADLDHPLWSTERGWWKKLWEQAAAPAPRRAARREAEESCPYPGLRAFTEDEARWFFGRRALVSLVKERFERSLADHRPLVVVAPSGAGKSSLLQAGVLPELRAGKLPGSRHWPQVLLTPTADPPAALAARLAELTGAEAAELAQAGPDELAELVRERLCLKPDGRVVLVVDQFEELFTLCQDERRRHRFVDALAALTGSAVVLSLYGLRADFYGSCADFPHLRDALAERQVIVSALTDEEVRQAVTSPAEGCGLSPETGLVDLILRDLRGGTGRLGDTYRAELLPRLAHALRVMWLNREGDSLTVAGYHASGGIDGAIASTAEAEFASLATESARNAARRLFLGLVRVGDHGEVTRRRRTRDELVRDATDPATVEEVLDRFVRARLLTQGAERQVEVTHEALLWAWPQLRAWIEKDLESLPVRQRLDEAVQEWARHGRDPAYLYRGLLLENAEQAVGGEGPEIGPLTREFLQSSIRRRAAEESAARAEQEAVRRRSRNRMALSAALALLLVAALTAAGIAFDQNREIAGQRDQAVGAQMANLALSIRRSDPVTARRLALAGAALAPDDVGTAHALQTVYQQAERSVYRPEQVASVYRNDGDSEGWFYDVDRTGRTVAYAKDRRVLIVDVDRRALRHAFTVPGDPIRQMSLSEDGTSIAMSQSPDDASSSYTARVWDAASGRPLGVTLKLAESPFVGLSATGRYLYVPAGARWRLWDTRTGAPVLDISQSSDDGQFAFTLDDRRLLTFSGGRASVWDLSTGLRLSSTAVAAQRPWFAIGPEKGQIAYADGRRLRILQEGAADIVRTMPAESGGRLVFSADGRYILAGGVLWDLTERQDAPVFRFDLNACDKQGFDVERRSLSCVDQDGYVRLFSLGMFLGQLSLDGVHAAFSADGSALAIRDGDHIRVWDTVRKTEQVVLPAQAGNVRQSLALSPDGTLLAAPQTDGEIALWDVRSGSPLTSIKIPARLTEDFPAPVFTPDGRTLITYGGEEGPFGAPMILRFWDVRSARLLSEVSRDDGWSGGLRAERPLVSQDGRWMLYSGRLELPTGRRLPQPGPAIKVAELSPDGTAIVSNYDKITLWDIGQERPLGGITVEGYHSGPLRFSPDGRLIAASDDTGRVHLTDVHTRSSFGLPLAGTYVSAASAASSWEAVREMAFSADGSLLHVIDAHNRLRTHVIGTARIKQALCQETGPLGPDAWKQHMPDVPYRRSC